jgi:hypothetical protein
MNTLAVTLRASLKRLLPIAAAVAAIALTGGCESIKSGYDSVKAKFSSDKAAATPITATFAKNPAATTEGPYVLTLTNTTDHSVKVSVHVDEDVTSHNRPKARDVGPQDIAPGGTWKVDNLAAQDKVTVTGDGLEPMKLTVQ